MYQKLKLVSKAWDKPDYDEIKRLPLVERQWQGIGHGSREFNRF